MPRGTATILVGVAIGLFGIMLYTRLREAAAEDDAEALIDRISQNLFELEHEPEVPV